MIHHEFSLKAIIDIILGAHIRRLVEDENSPNSFSLSNIYRVGFFCGKIS